MGVCKYCWKKAGFLSHKHKECEQKFLNGQIQITQEIQNCIIASGNYDLLVLSITKIAKTSFIPTSRLYELLISSFEVAIDSLTQDSVISLESQKSVNSYIKYFDLSQDSLDKNGSYSKMIKSSILSQVFHGFIPTAKLATKFSLPFNFLKDEKLIWTDKNVEYLEQRTSTHYQGSSHGFSVRIVKGLYYRTGSFNSYPVETTARVSFGMGIIAITDKCI